MAQQVVSRPNRPFSAITRSLINLLLLSLLVLVAVIITERSGWIELPKLVYFCLFTLFFAWLLGMSKLSSWVCHLVSTFFALAGIMGLGASTMSAPGWSSKLSILLYRIDVWWDIVRGGAPAADSLPLVLLMLFIMWLMSYLSMWWMVRHRHKWTAVIPTAFWIFVNSRYIPHEISLYFGLYLLILTLFIVNLALKDTWRYSQRLASLALLLTVSLPIMGIAWNVPSAKIPGAGGFKSRVESQWMRLEYGFNRYFTPNPVVETLSSGAASLHSFDSEMTLKGGIDLPHSPVMTVKSPVAGYLIGATYDVYTGRGWQQTAPNAPPVAGILEVLPEVYQSRQNIALTIEVDNPTDVVFYMGQPRSSSLRSTALFSSPMTFYLPLGAGSPSSVFPEDVQKLAGELGQSFTGSRGANELRRIASIPSQGFTLKRIVREGSRYRAVEVTRQEPEFQDVLGVRHLAGIKRKTVYSIESSVSTATHLVLGKAPTDYPGWVTDRYLQLPEDFPDSVKQLAREITEDAENPYEKALAIESYLRRLTYNTAINYPPADMDVVEYFLFYAPEGYCDYFASTMAVMLRSVGIPARIVAGYNNGEYDIEDDVYVIRESNAHSWPEVFFPGYGWVEFEPTPSQALPAHEPAPAYIEDEEEDLVEIAASESGFRKYKNLIIPLGASGLVLFMAILWWNLSLFGLAFPATTYQKLRRLGFLVREIPRSTDTPWEYGNRLEDVLPDRAGDINEIVTSYVGVTFAGKRWDGKTRSSLEAAWRRTRKAMINRMLRLPQ